MCLPKMMLVGHLEVRADGGEPSVFSSDAARNVASLSGAPDFTTGECGLQQAASG